MTTTKSRQEVIETGMILHYLAEEILKILPDGTGDQFGIGEDDFIIELYPFAELIEKRITEAYADGKQANGVFVFDAMPEVAIWFVEAAMRVPEPPLNTPLKLNVRFPELDEFDLDLARVIEVHMPYNKRL